MLRRIFFAVMLLCAFAGLSAYSFGQNKLNLSPNRWSQLQTMHFDLYFPARADSFGRAAALMAEEIYYLLRDDLTFPAVSRIPIILYPNKSDFQNTNIIYPLLTEGVEGFTESLHNRVVVPFEGSYRDLEILLAHELTHAYLNALDSSAFSQLSMFNLQNLPFWFSEGLPEFISIGGGNDLNNMYVLDMVINDKLPSLEDSYGFYSYRLGESFLSFIAANWGRSKVAEYFFALRSVNNLDRATKKVFGLKFKDLESRWRYQLKRDYYHLVNSHEIPGEAMEQRTESEKDGSYLNFLPRFSPDGERYAWFSTAGGRYSIWLAGQHGLSAPKKILTGEATGKVEEFYYFRSNLSWFPDNHRLAFAAKTSNGDRIHILDTEQERIVETLDIKGFDALYELDVAPDGQSLVFAGQKDLQCDLFLYDIGSEELRQLTNDLYNDAQPRFSADGHSVVFTAERRCGENKGKGIFSALVSQVFSLDLASGTMRQHSGGESDCSFPLLDSGRNRIYYVTAADGVRNLFALDLSTGEQAQVTKVLSGVYSADLSPDGRQLLLSNYFDAAWNIFIQPVRGDSLAWQAVTPAWTDGSARFLKDEVDLARLAYYGKRDRKRPARINPASAYNLRDPLLGPQTDFEFTREDSLQLGRDFSYDDRPKEPGNVPETRPYRTRFQLDNLWGGLAYSPGLGTVGYVELSLSDLMGDHGIGISAEIAGKLEDSSLLLTYLFLKRRTDLGIGAFNLFDEVILREPQTGLDNYYRYRQRQTGAYFLIRYPFSRFFRLESDHLIYQRGQDGSIWIWDTGSTGHWGPTQDLGQDLVYTPGINLVHDNALYGSTGPLLGWRGLYNVSTTLVDGKPEYVTNYLDWRSYRFFNKRYALAFRAIGGISTGKEPERFDLGGYYGVRGYDGDLTGAKKALLSAELRFPFFDAIKLAFPVPIGLTNIRGSLFTDLGTVFDETETFRGMKDGVLQDLYLSYGFGPRLDLGYLVLRFDVAWLTDLARHTRPIYYLSLSEDF